tara:strand:- start:628 stop:876 length:249 start_codon:yes stop_codon:yes gene_type:complete
MKEIKNAVIGVIVLAITTLGGVLINKYIGGEEDEVKEVAPQPTININIPQQEVKKDTVVKIIKQKPKPKLSETEKRKKKIDW